MRAYELMIIFEANLEESTIDQMLNRVGEVVGGHATVATTEKWGKRRFAYPIEHRWEGFYTVQQLVGAPAFTDDLDRFLRLADEVVRHKLVCLPDHEAARRGLLEAATAPGEA